MYTVSMKIERETNILTNEVSMNTEIKKLFTVIAESYETFFENSFFNEPDILKHKEERVKEFADSLYIDMKMKYIRIATRWTPNGGSGHTWGYIEKSTGEFCINATPSAKFKKSRGNIFKPETWGKVRWTGPTYLN